MPTRRNQKLSQNEKKPSKSSKDVKKNTDSSKNKNGKEKNDKKESNSGDTKMTLCTYPTTVGVRPQTTRERRPGRPPSGKRLQMVREMPAKVRSAIRRSLDPCDNSNDSGLGFDHHGDPQHLGICERVTWTGERAEAKRLRVDIKLEQDDRYNFPESLTCKNSTSLIRTAPSGTIPSLSITNNPVGHGTGHAVPRCVPLSNRPSSSSPISLTTQLTNVSRYKDICLQILKQPEQQHRARYQTEGSRGAVKDREGNGFPIVQLNGYYQPTTLQVFIGTDVGKVSPHMFYQACKVSGKNSTPCVERNIDGTCVIELQLDPTKDMSATCDCVGILKERNVDVEHRFPDQTGNRSKKKSTRCRMIFRTTITLDDGTTETLQVCSQPIICTQPPGVPEICKKSLTSCPATGGLELFVLGKNFLKDTKVYFQQFEDDNRHIRWEQVVVPDKEYLQQTHFVCVIPPYRRPDITEPVTVRLCVVSSGKTSDPHQFVYTPVNGAIPSVVGDAVRVSTTTTTNSTTNGPFFNKLVWPSVVSKREQDLGMMPPPESSMVPMVNRRTSLSMASTSDLQHSPPLRTLKQEYIDENSQNSIIDPVDLHPERFRHISESSLDVNHSDHSNLSMINENSMDVIHNHNHNSLMSEHSNDNSLDTTNLNQDSNNMVLSQPLMQNILAATGTATAEELKVMDLRMKMPMATVADLVNSNAPSMATLQSFGVTESSTTPLPTQSAQSVENYLTNIESKLTTSTVVAAAAAAAASTIEQLSSDAVYLSSQRSSFLSSNRSTQNEVMQLVAKSEAAAIAEQISSEHQTTVTTTISNIPTNLETVVATQINTEKLDDLVNSTVESHMGSPTTTTTPENPTDVMLSSRNVMLNQRLSPPTMIVSTPSMISPLQELTTHSPEVILNTQIPPTLMCRQAETLMPTTHTVDTTSLLPTQSSLTTVSTNPLTIVTTTEPENAVLLEAAVDLLKTQKKLSELEQISTAANIVVGINDVTSQLQGNNFTTAGGAASGQVAPAGATTTTTTCNNNNNNNKDNNTGTVVNQQNLVQTSSTRDFVIPVPVKEITGVSVGQDKKNEDRMIPQAFTSLTENELINFINPSCFDQV